MIIFLQIFEALSSFLTAFMLVSTTFEVYVVFELHDDIDLFFYLFCFNS